LSDQVLAQPPVRAWLGLLRSYRSLTRDLSARLLAQHGLTQNDYEVLAQLSRAEGGRLRRVDLAERLMLTPSGITRLLDGLEACGYVAKATCDTDARVTYAVITEAGYAKLAEASESHLADIEAALGCLAAEELATLGELPSRLRT